MHIQPKHALNRFWTFAWLSWGCSMMKGVWDLLCQPMRESPCPISSFLFSFCCHSKVVCIPQTLVGGTFDCKSVYFSCSRNLGWDKHNSHIFLFALKFFSTLIGIWLLTLLDWLCSLETWYHCSNLVHCRSLKWSWWHSESSWQALAVSSMIQRFEKCSHDPLLHISCWCMAVGYG